jgi:excisionase family DNA binding protein
MAYFRPPDRLEINWDPPGFFGGVTIRRRILGKWYEWRVPHNGVVNQAMAADLLGVTRMSVNNWVRAGKLKHLKIPGHPSAIPLSDVKRIKKELQRQPRLRWEAEDDEEED